jgi:hypothetical protein
MSDATSDNDDDIGPWTTASESLRSVVKWIATSFGALGISRLRNVSEM